MIVSRTRPSNVSKKGKIARAERKKEALRKNCSVSSSKDDEAKKSTNDLLIANPAMTLKTTTNKLGSALRTTLTSTFLA